MIAYLELFTGSWDKKHDSASGLIEMGVRPYESAIGRFLSVDPVDGGALNDYDYALQDPINGYDLDGRVGCLPGALGAKRLIDRVPGLYDFGTYCDRHDDCYGKWGEHRRRCDSEFKASMSAHCSGRHGRFDPRRYVCRGIATTFFAAVSGPGGTAAFVHAQVGTCLEETSLSLSACVDGAADRSGDSSEFGVLIRSAVRLRYMGR